MGWKAGILSILGIWLLISTFSILHSQELFWNNLIVGTCAVVMGGILARDKSWQGCLAIAFGAWLFISSFIPNLNHGDGICWNNLIIALGFMVDASTAYPEEYNY